MATRGNTKNARKKMENSTKSARSSELVVENARCFAAFYGAEFEIKSPSGSGPPRQSCAVRKPPLRGFSKLFFFVRREVDACPSERIVHLGGDQQRASTALERLALRRARKVACRERGGGEGVGRSWAHCTRKSRGAARARTPEAQKGPRRRIHGAEGRRRLATTRRCARGRIDVKPPPRDLGLSFPPPLPLAASFSAPGARTGGQVGNGPADTEIDQRRERACAHAERDRKTDAQEAVDGARVEHARRELVAQSRLAVLRHGSGLRAR